MYINNNAEDLKDNPLLDLMEASSIKIIWVKIIIQNHCLRKISLTFKYLIKMRIIILNLKSLLRNRFKN
jgi:hypothetical protein